MMQLSALGVALQLEPEELDSSPVDQIFSVEERIDGRRSSGGFDSVQFGEKQSLPLPRLDQSSAPSTQDGSELCNIGPPPGLELRREEGHASAANAWDLTQPHIPEPAYIKLETGLLDSLDGPPSYLDEWSLKFR
jgi:hypothetical protein